MATTSGDLPGADHGSAEANHAVVTDAARHTGIGRATQSAIYRAGASGSMPTVPTSWHALEAAAQKAMSAEAWAYVAGSSGSEATTAANHRAFENWQIVPRILRD